MLVILRLLLLNFLPVVDAILSLFPWLVTQVDFRVLPLLLVLLQFHQEELSFTIEITWESLIEVGGLEVFDSDDRAVVVGQVLELSTNPGCSGV